MPREEAKAIINKTNQRKMYTFSKHRVMKTKKVRNYEMRECPVPGCKRYVKRLEDHIRYMHSNFNRKLSSNETVAGESQISQQEAPSFDDDQVVTYDNDQGDLPSNEELNKPYLLQSRRSRLAPKEEICLPSRNLADIPEGSYYYTSTLSNFKEKADVLLRDYKQHLLSCDAGCKTERAANQMTGHIANFIVELCDDSFENLFSLDKVRDLFTEKTSTKKWKASSASTYRNTLKDFLSYLELRRKIIVPPLIINDMRAALKRWAKSNHVLFKHQTYQKRKTTEKLLLSPEEIQEYYKSEFCRDAIKMFGKALDGEDFGRKEFCTMRNYLFLGVYFKQGLRTGILAELTVDEYRQREFDSITSLTSIEVSQHKTSKTYGDAVIAISESLANEFDIYFKHVRPVALVGRTCNNFFTTWNGRAMNSSDINAACKSSLQDAGITNACVTLIRKSLVTTVHEHGNEDEMKNVSIGMDHDVNTAKLHYAHRNKVKAVLKAYQNIEKLSCRAIEKGEFYLYNSKTFHNFIG